MEILYACIENFFHNVSVFIASFVTVFSYFSASWLVKKFYSRWLFLIKTGTNVKLRNGNDLVSTKFY